MASSATLFPSPLQANCRSHTGHLGVIQTLQAHFSLRDFELAAMYFGKKHI